LTAAQNTDSLAYFEARDKFFAGDKTQSETIVKAADELAAEGLFRDATSLLIELPKNAKTDSVRGKPQAPAAAPPSAKRERVSWRISSAADYTRMEDLASVDTSRPETRDSLARLLENPLTISSKAVLSWKPGNGMVRLVEPSFSLSNLKAAADVRADLSLSRMLGVEAGVRAEKRVTERRTDPSGPPGAAQKTVFVGDREDSLDMVGSRLTVTPGFDRKAGFFKGEMPLSLEIARYRHGKGGYYSHRTYRTAPALSLAAADLRKNASVRLLGEYRDYSMGTGETVSRADSFDIYRLGPEINADMNWRRFSAIARLGFLYECYLHRSVPSTVRTLNAEGQFRTTPLDGLEALLQIRYEYRNEIDKGTFNFFKDTVTIINFMGISASRDTVVIRSINGSFTLDGHETEISPAVRWSPLAVLTLELRCPITLRSYSIVEALDGKRLTAPAYILESREALEPEIGFDYSGKRVNVRASGAYLREDVPLREYYTLSSSRGWKARADCMGRISSAMYCYAQAEYQFRRFAPYAKNSRTATNLTTASGLSLRF
jgi:hypothetical protein